MGPAETAKRIEDNSRLPSGNDERVGGYAIMGVPFESGEMLAVRRWVASSFGPPYDSVWHRNADGDWRIFVNAPLEVSCPRFFGAGVVESARAEIVIDWTGPDTLFVEVGGGRILWESTFGQTASTRMMNAMAALMPSFMWRSATVLKAMGKMAGPMLSAGKIGMTGRVPNGQRAMVNPMKIWTVKDSHATIEGRNLGAPGSVGPQDRLGDFWMPQRGLFVIAAFHAEQLDPSRHSIATHTNAEVSGRLRA